MPCKQHLNHAYITVSSARNGGVSISFGIIIGERERERERDALRSNVVKNHIYFQNSTAYNFICGAALVSVYLQSYLCNNLQQRTVLLIEAKPYAAVVLPLMYIWQLINNSLQTLIN